MDKILRAKTETAILHIKALWKKVKHHVPFIAFSTGKDSLALTAMVYEALGQDAPPCVYVHHRNTAKDGITGFGDAL